MTDAELIAALSDRGWSDLADEVRSRSGGLSSVVRKWLPGMRWRGDAFIQCAEAGPAVLTIFDQRPVARLGICLRFEGISLRVQSCHASDAAAFVVKAILARLDNYSTSDRRSATVQHRVAAARLAYEAIRIATAPECREAP